MSDTRAIQAKLIELGYSVGKAGADGIAGRDTIAAIKQFQKDRGIEQSGIVDAATSKLLFSAPNTPGPKPIPPIGPTPTNNMPWIVEAKRYLGLKEVAGPGTNSTILGWLKKLKASWTDDETPWCGTFVGYCISATLPSERLPANPFGARNWATFGVHAKPGTGCVLVFWRGSPQGWNGHVGFYVGEDDAAYHVLGGNQGNSVSITRVPKERLIDARLPSSITVVGSVPVRMRPDGSLSANEA